MKSWTVKRLTATRVKSMARVMAAGCGGLLPTEQGPRVLCYHGVCDEPEDEWSITPAQLRSQMEMVARDRVPVSLDRIAAWVLGQEDLPRGAVAVTFDDGFQDVLRRAAPILAEFDVPGAVFVSTALASHGASAGDESFNSGRPFMNWEQVRELHDAGWTVGSHCITHARLATLPMDRALVEIRDSRREIGQRLGTECLYIAYPYGTPGAVSKRELGMASEAGYRAGFLAVTGPARRGSDPFAIPRSKVLGTDRPVVVAATLSGKMDIWRHIENRH
ncbi:MAG: polysaccharide deacetylase family protein [Deltaproteobacteria bacterium]|nr:polysaccharide deacetylase family protein [Deltaproteobacteria bacterium]